MFDFDLNGTLTLEDGTRITDGHIEVEYVIEHADGRKAVMLVFFNEDNTYRIAREYEFTTQGGQPLVTVGDLRNYVTSIDPKFSISAGQGNGGSQSGDPK